MIVAGLDPGKTGALVVLYEDGSTLVLRVPLTKEKPFRPDWEKWSNTWRFSLSISTPDVFVAEAVHGWKGQAAGASFAFGQAEGFAKALIMSVNRPIHKAPPSVWKAKLKISQDKADAIAEASRLIPSLIPHMRRKKDDGVAEAGLLAYYGLMTISAK